MAYTIIRSDGTTLTTIQDGTLNTTSTSLGLPGRNYAGYGQALNTNFVRQLESYSGATPPNNPLKGQLWYNSTQGTLNVCPADGTTSPSAWLTLASTNAGGDTTLGNITATGSILGDSLTVAHGIIGDTITVRLATVSEELTALAGTITSGTITSLNTTTISTGAPTTAGTLTGEWTVVGNNLSGGNALSISSGNIQFGHNSLNGVKCDNYMYANGAPFNPSGTYTNANVAAYLPTYSGNISPTKVTTSYLAGGGLISGTWTLDTGARINATYADLAERFEADDVYDTGTVVEIGGVNEITAVQDDLSEEVFGVVSTTAAFTMNGQAGSDKTHPAIAVSGRVPVKVIGKVKKGQRLVSAGKGYARAATKSEMTAFNVIGRALEDKTDVTTGTVLAVVSITK
jgi:hypothetical protein